MVPPYVQAAPEESIVSSLWKLVVDDDKPAQQGDSLVRLLSESLAREAGLIRLELEKYGLRAADEGSLSVGSRCLPLPRLPRTAQVRERERHAVP